MSAVITPVGVDCDFFIREANGGWILVYPEGGLKDEDGLIETHYTEQIFTDEQELVKFVADRMIAFKLWRSRRIVDFNGSKSNWIDYMNPESEPLPKKRDI